MKKWIIAFFLAGAGYLVYRFGLVPWPEEGAFDAEGRPVARLLVGPGCGRSCEEVKGLLRERRVAFEIVDISRGPGKKYGIKEVPVMMVGAQRVVGNDRDTIISMLAENFGPEVLSANEQLAMRNHFDENGKPIVVMYGTKSCSECRAQREFFRAHQIDYHEIDVEESHSGKLAYDMLHGDGVPMIYVGYRRFNGYTTDEIADALQEFR